jgi:hypothetical protein
MAAHVVLMSMSAVLRVVRVAKKKKKEGKKKREREVLRYSLSAVKALSRMELFEFAKCEADGNVTEVEALEVRRTP